MGCCVIGTALLLASCGAPASNSSRATTKSSSATRSPVAAGIAGKVHWLIASSAILRMRDTAGASFVETYFDSPNTTILLSGSEPAFFDGWSALFALDSKNASGLSSVKHSSTAASFVLYDDEDWSLTPRWQQLNPVSAVDLAARDANANHLRLITSPAVDLGGLISGAQPMWQRFLNSSVLSASARVSSAVNIQAQSFEKDPAMYATFVQRAVAEIHAANPSAMIYAGLSTNPRGATVSSTVLQTDIEGTDGEVQGYWLNIPGASSECPTCGLPRPAVAIELMEGLSTLPVN